MDLGIKGRNAFVTGGSLGIGKAIAAELAANGVNVAIVARDEARLEAAARELASNSAGRVVPIQGDMSKLEQIEAAFAAARQQLGGIDILINNAGSSPAGRLQDLDDATWTKSFELKFMGYIRCARLALPEMRERKWGRIINVTGLGGEKPSPTYLLGAYNAALAHFTQALAPEAALDGVLVTAISPGAVNTPRWQTMLEQQSQFLGRPKAEINAERTRTMPLGRPAEVGEIAGLAAFLCSDRAGYIAGAQISVNGATTRGV